MLDIGIQIAIERVRETVQDAQRVGTGVSNAMGQAQRATSKAGGAFSSLRSEVPLLDRALTALKNPIVGIGLAAVGVTAAFGDAIGTANRFEKALTDAAAIITTGLDTGEAQRQIAALGAEAERLGASTEFGASDAAQAIEFLGRAGFTTNQILAKSESGVSTLESTLALATVGNLELAQSADIASNVLSQFQKDSSELASVVDVIAKTTTSANTNVEQYAQALNFLGPTAAALNISLEETSAAIGILGNSGLQGSLATRALGTSLVNLTKPTKKAAGEIGRIGLNAFDAQGEFVGLANLVQQLQGAYADFTPEQRQASLATIFGAEAIQELNILLSAGADEIRTYTGEIEAAAAQQGGFSQQIRDTKLDTFSGSVKILESAYEGLQIALASGTLPILKEINFALADAISFITGLAKGTIGVEDAFGPFGEQVAGLVEDVQALGQRVQTFIADITSGSSGAGEVLSTLAEIIGNTLLSNIRTLIQAGTFLFDVVAEIITAVLDLIGILGGWVEALINVGGKILEVTGLGRVFESFKSSIVEFISDITFGLVDLGGGADNVGISFANLSAITSGVFASILQIIQNFVDGAVANLEGIGNIIEGIFTLDVDKISEGFEQVKNGIISQTVDIAEGAGDAFTKAYNSRIIEASTVSLPDPVEVPVEVQNATQAVSEGLSKAELKQAATEAGLKVSDWWADGIEQGIEQNIDLQGIELGQISIPSVAIETPEVDAAGAGAGVTAMGSEFERWSELAELFGQSVDSLRDRFTSVSEVVNFATSDMFTLAEAFTQTDAQAFELAIRFQELGKEIQDTLVNGAVGAFNTFGKEIGKAIKQGTSFKDAFAAAFKSLLGTLLVEVPKLIGLFLLETAVGLGFPAGIPAAIAGIALVGFSGVASGLLGGGGASRAPSANEQTTSQPSQNERDEARRAQSLASNESAAPNVQIGLSVNLETDGIAERVSEQLITNEELTNGRR